MRVEAFTSGALPRRGGRAMKEYRQPCLYRTTLLFWGLGSPRHALAWVLGGREVRAMREGRQPATSPSVPPAGLRWWGAAW